MYLNNKFTVGDTVYVPNHKEGSVFKTEVVSIHVRVDCDKVAILYGVAGSVIVRSESEMFRNPIDAFDSVEAQPTDADANAST